MASEGERVSNWKGKRSELHCLLAVRPELSLNHRSGRLDASALGQVKAWSEVQGQKMASISLQQARSSYLRHHVHERTPEQREMKARERHDAAVRVRRELQALEKAHIVPRPLRRFGVKMMVVLIHHRISAKGNETLHRRMVAMEDRMKWDKMQHWVDIILSRHEHAKTSVRFEYISQNGERHPIHNQRTLQAWLDTVWCSHPPRLHVYEFTNADLVNQALNHTEEVRRIFEEYDENKDDYLSLTELKEMMLDLDLFESIGCSKDDLAMYVVEEFEKADADKTSLLSFEEFVSYYNSMRDVLKQRLSSGEHKHKKVYDDFREEFVEAKSFETAVEHVVSRKERLQAHAHVVEPVSGKKIDGGRLLLSALGHDFGVEVIINQKILTPANRNRWVRAECVLEHDVDHFSDASGSVANLMSPTVHVEFEGDAAFGHLAVSADGADHATFGDDGTPYLTVAMPHCFGAMIDDETPLSINDLVVVYGSWESGEWVEVDPKHCALLDERPMAEYGSPMPFLAVQMIEPGMVCAFSRRDPLRKPLTRVQCVAFVPAKMSPLEVHTLRVYVTPYLPDAVEHLRVTEMHSRGTVVIAGVSDVFEVEHGRFVSITIGDEKMAKITHSIAWVGETAQVEFDFDPDDLLHTLIDADDKAHHHTTTDFTEGRGEVHGALQLSVELVDLCTKSRGVSGHTRTVTNLRKRQTRIDFSAHVAIHHFPAPTAPYGLKLKSRTSTTLHLEWRPPKSWGGCALIQYELELLEITHDGKEGSHGWGHRTTVSSAHPSGTIYATVYMADARVRVYNVGSREPSPWSEVLRVQTEHDEMLKKAPVLGADGKPVHKAHIKKHDDHLHDEGGAAVVEQTDLDTLIDIPHKMTNLGYLEHRHASDFQLAIGNFMIETGVYGGVRGTVFDFTPAQVEELVIHHADEPDSRLDIEKPLMSLAIAAVWVLQTLAHHSKDTETWIVLMNEINGIVSLASQAPEESSTEPMLHSLLLALIDVYETLRMCEPDGFIQAQLGYKYEKKLGRLLSQDWEEQLEKLKEAVVTHAMELVLYERFKTFGLKKLMHDCHLGAGGKSMMASKGAGSGRRLMPQGTVHHKAALPGQVHDTHHHPHRHE